MRRVKSGQVQAIIRASAERRLGHADGDCNLLQLNRCTSICFTLQARPRGDGWAKSPFDLTFPPNAGPDWPPSRMLWSNRSTVIF